ncbi:MAG: agmatinase family protein [Phycisphaeraceae bacterium]|nr:agmatinase family protein [Phycisphaeraceae bacterium]
MPRTTTRRSPAAPRRSRRAAAPGTPVAPHLPPSFDPDAAATGDGLFGLPFHHQDAAVVVIPVPFDATTSYRPGTASGPRAVLEASRQVDLQDGQYGAIWRGGPALLPFPSEIAALSKETRRRAEPIIRAGGADPRNRHHAKALDAVNRASARVNTFVRSHAKRILERGAIPALLGGDHSTPFGLIEELAHRQPGLGILQIDAHADLRESFEGFTWSHASIFHNVMSRLPQVAKLVQVGIRDFGVREMESVNRSRGRICCFRDQELRDRQFAGGPRGTWRSLCREMIDMLPQEVYISFDIDGLTPDLCPGTGTPVPGGLSFAEVSTLLFMLATSGRRVLGFDLCEVAPARGDGEWNANVGARVLYKLLGCTLASRGLIRIG